jgi:hypothetical protein
VVESRPLACVVYNRLNPRHAPLAITPPPAQHDGVEVIWHVTEAKNTRPHDHIRFLPEFPITIHIYVCNAEGARGCIL